MTCVSGISVAAKVIHKLMTKTTNPMVGRLEIRVNIHVDERSPNRPTVVARACPVVRISVLSTSVVETQVVPRPPNMNMRAKKAKTMRALPFSKKGTVYQTLKVKLVNAAAQ